MSTGFMFPTLFYWGLGLASIPIIIHLLNRRRFRRIEWAPMKYLKLSIKHNRRRIQIEQWILLAMRIAAILLLFGAVARPVMHAEGFGSFLGARSRTSQIVVLDDSLSMGYRENGVSAFSRAKKLAAEVVRTIGPQDRLTLALASAPLKPLRRSVQLTEADEMTRVLEEIERLRPTAVFVPWGPTLEAVAELVETSTFPIREVTLLTDRRRAGWDRRVTEVGNKWANQRVTLRVLDVGSADESNLALLDLESIDRVALVGAPTRWSAVIANNTTAVVEGKEATLTVDGKAQAVVLPKIPPSSVSRVPVQAVFQEAGPHRVSFQLPEDALLEDNTRFTIVQVKETLNILLVDGEPSAQPFEGETDFLSLALSVGIGAADSWRIETVADSGWTVADAEASDLDLIVLANVASPTPRQAEWLTRMVRAGAGLMIFLGDQTAPDVYNRLFYKDGAGLLPAALEGVADIDAAGLLVEDVNPSPLAALSQLKPAVLEKIKPRKFGLVRLAGDKPAGTRVVARWNDPPGSPAALEKAFGNGRTLLWTITADRAWSDWPTEPSYVLAMREAAKAIARVGGGGLNWTAGDSIRLPVSDAAAEPTVEIPDGKEPSQARVEGEGAAGGKTLVWEATQQPGFYKIVWRDGGRKQEEAAVSPDRRESDLHKIPEGELREIFGDLKPEIILASAVADGSGSLRGQEIWRGLVAALLGLTALEAAFATWTGRQR